MSKMVRALILALSTAGLTACWPVSKTSERVVDIQKQSVEFPEKWMRLTLISKPDNDSEKLIISYLTSENFQFRQKSKGILEVKITNKNNTTSEIHEVHFMPIGSDFHLVEKPEDDKFIYYIFHVDTNTNQIGYIPIMDGISAKIDKSITTSRNALERLREDNFEYNARVLKSKKGREILLQSAQELPKNEWVIFGMEWAKDENKELAKSANNSIGLGNWRVTVENDAITKERSEAIQLKSKENRNYGFVFLCTNGQLIAGYVNESETAFQDHYPDGAFDAAILKMRMGESQIETLLFAFLNPFTLTMASPNQQSFAAIFKGFGITPADMRKDATPAWLLTEMIKHDQLYVRSKRYNGATDTVKFNPKADIEAIKKALPNCSK